ncbi:hypothetical protein ScPMuIL_002456 [Solemya velum]
MRILGAAVCITCVILSLLRSITAQSPTDNESWAIAAVAVTAAALSVAILLCCGGFIYFLYITCVRSEFLV